MMHRINFPGQPSPWNMMIKNGLPVFLKSPQKGLVPSQAFKPLLVVESRLVVSDVVGVYGFSSAAAIARRRFFNTCHGAALDHCFGSCKSAPIDEHHVSFNQFPGLMVPGTDENNETRCFMRFNPNSGSFEKDVDCNLLPVPHRYVCRGSAYGWVFLVDDELDTKLMNPLTGDEIQLPSVRTLPRPSRSWIGINKWYVLKAVFSSDPSLQPPPLVLVIHQGHTPRLAYCKPGDKSWTSLHRRHRKHKYEDVIFYKDQFYAMNYTGYIMAYDIGRRTDDNDDSVKSTLIASAPKEFGYYNFQQYLVELDEELIKVTRRVRYESNKCYTAIFMIRRFVASENKWVKVETLGDKALFLGVNTSFWLRASEHLGCIPNAIYFTDRGTENFRCKDKDYGYDMGIYKLSDQSVTPLYTLGSGSTIPPPVMVTRVPCSAGTDI